MQRKDPKKENEIDNITVAILSREQSPKYLGQTMTFQQQETTEIKNRIRAAWTTFYKIQTRADLEIVPSSASASLIRHGGHPNDELRLRTTDPHKRARKNTDEHKAKEEIEKQRKMKHRKEDEEKPGKL